jgi:hypothetical protein
MMERSALAGEGGGGGHIHPLAGVCKYILDLILNGIFIVLGTLLPEDCPPMSSELLRYPFLIFFYSNGYSKQKHEVCSSYS